MTHLEFDTVGPDLPDTLLAEMGDLFALCFGQPPDADFAGRVREKHRPRAILARSNGLLVGYKLGYERFRGLFYSWLGGVHPNLRRNGIARELMRRQHALCRDLGYEAVLTETANRFRGMLILNLREGFDVIGTSIDAGGELTILMRKSLRDY